MIQTAADLRSFVERRLLEMRSCPHMWAWTKEGFAMQVSLLVEIVSDADPSRFIQQIFPQGTSGSERLDDTWACEVIDVACVELR